MAGWLILAGILALLLLLLLSPVTFALDYDTPRERFFWRLAWLQIRLLDSDGKGILQRKRGKKKKSKEKTEEKPERSRAEKLRHGWEVLQNSLRILPKPLRLLWKGLSIRGLVIGVQIGRFDAKECAMAYAKANALLYPAVGLLRSTARVQVRQLEVRCAFGRDCTDWVVRGKLRACPLAGLLALLSFAVGYAMQKSDGETTDRRTIKGGYSNGREKTDSGFDGNHNGKNA